MTGFGAATASAKGLTLRAELRSVNHRHLLVKLRLPADCAELEPGVEALIRKRLARGSVTAHVHLTTEGSAAAARIDGEVARAYRDQLRDLGKKLGLDSEVRLAELLPLPGVVGSREGNAGSERVERLVLRAVGDALGDLLGMREAEGEALARDLQRNATAIRRSVKRIAARMPKVVEHHRQQLTKRVQTLLGSASSVNSADLAREVALLSDRLDVSEELTRLEAHLDQLDKLLAKGGSVGRKLDFLAQEFFREANTVGSKCSDARVAHEVVELKTHIERLREQVQNVE